jgi:hypothetical protein
MISTKEILILTAVVVLIVALALFSYFTNGIIVIESLSSTINHQIVYQSITLLAALLFVLVLWSTKTNSFQKYFRKGNIRAKIGPVPMIGLKPKPHENWLHLGRNYTIIISFVTAIIIYFQLFEGSSISLNDVLMVLPFSLVFALSNSFVEEIITRFAVVITLKGVVRDKSIQVISALIFGIVHYWGNPGGIIGVLAAAFLGWFLAKSIIETEGIFWAWLIHFCQDLIIFSALLNE